MENIFLKKEEHSVFSWENLGNIKVREIDCWANGDRVCRFKGSVLG